MAPVEAMALPTSAEAEAALVAGPLPPSVEADLMAELAEIEAEDNPEDLSSCMGSDGPTRCRTSPTRIWPSFWRTRPSQPR